MDIEIIDQPARHRYELSVDGAPAGVAIYDDTKGHVITLLHTEIDPAFEGRGLGSRLARHVLDDIRARGLGVRAECPFMARYIGTHREYQDLLIA